MRLYGVGNKPLRGAEAARRAFDVVVIVALQLPTGDTQVRLGFLFKQAENGSSGVAG